MILNWSDLFNKRHHLYSTYLYYFIYSVICSFIFLSHVIFFLHESKKFNLILFKFYLWEKFNLNLWLMKMKRQQRDNFEMDYALLFSVSTLAPSHPNDLPRNFHKFLIFVFSSNLFFFFIDENQHFLTFRLKYHFMNFCDYCQLICQYYWQSITLRDISGKIVKSFSP